MKKVLFLIVTLVCAVTGAWAADLSVNTVDGVLTITSVNKDQLKDYNSFSNADKQATKLVLVGKFSENDLMKIYPSGSDFNFVSIDISEVTEELGKIKFGKYASTLQEVVLPASAIADNFDQNDFWSNNKCENLTKVTSGETYAEVYKDGGNMKAKVHCTSDEEYERMRRILSRCNFVDYNNNFTKIISQSDTDTEYIRFNETTKVYDVLVTSTGKFSSLFGNLSNVPADAVFHFESGCTNISADDLALLSGSDTNGKYYIDLYDVPTSEDLENVISSAVGKMANNNNKCKGLLLPKNPTGVGTMLICNGSENVNNGKATCSEFIAYHNNGTTMAHIYFADPQNSPNPTYEQRLQKLKSIMDTHVDENGSKVIEAATSVYGISTNKYTEITDIIGIINDADATVVHTYDNELVKSLTTGHDKPSVVATLETGGHLSEIFNNTGIQKTPNIDKLKLSGSVSAEDILAINSITTNGPDVLDLSNVTTSITSEMLAQLNNPYIEYIILPAGLTEPVRDYTSLTKLKCVISSNKSGDDSHVLTAYVREAGSLAKARCLATGNSDNSAFKPIVQGLTTVKLSGNLNASDISKSDDGGLRSENGTITSLDLTNALFANLDDMKLGYYHGKGADLTALTEVKLPTNEAIKTIPDNCLYGIQSLTNLHIPYNYENIGWEAFWETGITHITTEDANHVLIDNGPNTYTLSANIKVLGKKDQKEGTAVFPNVTVRDVYCLATDVPVCYASTFHANVVYGHGGPQGGVYCREKYPHIAVLHFPSLESFVNAGGSESAYSDMVDKYTDVGRAYSKKDQTGAIDANGNPLLWPTQEEMLGTRKMARDGHVWEDYENIDYANDGRLTDFGTASGDRKDFYPNFVGWHEFVLTQATYVKPAVNTETRNYYDAGLFTFCVPFDMTYSQVVNMLGIPASTDKVKNFEVDINGDIVTEGKEKSEEDGSVTKNVMPEIRQLSSVIRTKGEGGGRNTVYFRLTENLASETYKTAKYLDFEEGENNSTTVKSKYASNFEETTPTAPGEQDDPRCLVGGRPYLIKAYLPVGESVPERNLGKYILTRYTNEFTKNASCVNRADSYEQLFTYKKDNGQVKVDSKEAETMRFARPYEKHKVQAFDASENGGQLVFEENNKTHRYYYTMVGQFWDQDLPQYCIYLAQNGTWYRYATDYGFTWDRYKCIIMATPEVNEVSDVTEEDLAKSLEVNMSQQTEVEQPDGFETFSMPDDYTTTFNRFGGGFRDVAKCYFPMNYVGTADWIPYPMTLWFFGRNDYYFDNQKQASSRYVFTFDDEEEVVDYGENVTALKAVEMLNGVPQEKGNSKFYNLSGQYVGNSTKGLSKGVYIVDGHKVVVD